MVVIVAMPGVISEVIVAVVGVGQEGVEVVMLLVILAVMFLLIQD